MVIEFCQEVELFEVSASMFVQSPILGPSAGGSLPKCVLVWNMVKVVAHLLCLLSEEIPQRALALSLDISPYLL